MKKEFSLYVAAAATTAVVGIIHIMMSTNSLTNNVNAGILFLVGGIVQVFWVIPMLRKCGLTWYLIGIGAQPSLLRYGP
jgi:peptidoglycan biosynthesis protein MviN/MurJ (putative lipid II flippase)